MTLNITLLSDQTIYQSADFMLWDPAARRPVSVTSSKAVQVSTRNWRGAVTYAGVGRWDGLDTSEWLTRWLSESPYESFDNLVERIRLRGSDWLRDIRQRSRNSWHHTFVAAAYVSDHATAALISNFEHVGRAPSAKPSTALEVSHVVADTGPRVLVTGCVSPPVSRQQRRVLLGLVRRQRAESGRVRVAIRDLNRQAAASGGTACPISAECFVHSFDRYGAGQSSGAVEGAAPRLVFETTDVGAKLHEIAAQFFPGGYRLVGSSYASSRADNAPPKCTPSASSFPCADGVAVQELAGEGGGRATARASNSHGITVGCGSHLPGGPDMPLLWADTEVRRLTDLGGITGAASAVNEKGVTVGSVEDSARRSVAVRWEPDHTLNRLPVAGAPHAAATAISAAGDIVGWVSVHATGGEQAHHRPIVWRADGTIEVLRSLPAGWGMAASLNTHRQILVTGWKGAQAVPILWDADGARALSSGSQSIVGVGILDSGHVVGCGRDQNQDAVGLLWSPDESAWSRIGTEPGWVITAVSCNGYVAGQVELEGWWRPWIMPPGQKPQVVRHYAFHHHHVSSINRLGIASGSASTDHGSHALIWAPGFSG